MISRTRRNIKGWEWPGDEAILRVPPISVDGRKQSKLSADGGTR